MTDRPNLDRSDTGGRHACCDAFDRHEVVAVHEDEAADLLARLGVRPVDDSRLAIARPYEARRRRWAKWLRSD